MGICKLSHVSPLTSKQPSWFLSFLDPQQRLLQTMSPLKVVAMFLQTVWPVSTVPDTEKALEECGLIGRRIDGWCLSLACATTLRIKTDLSQCHWICLPSIFILEGSCLPLKVILPKDLVLSCGSTGPAYMVKRIIHCHLAGNHCLSFCRVRCLLWLSATCQVCNYTSQF